MRRQGRSPDFNYWPSVADMILAAFMVMLILWFSENLRSFALLADKQQASNQSAKLLADVERLRRENERLARAVMDNDQPPNIVLSESSEYKFATGSAALSVDFERRLAEEIFPRLQEILRRYPKVDLIEIIGHTDGAPITGRVSNLDRILDGAQSIDQLSAGSNADLGLMRACAIRLALQELARGGRLGGVRFRTYSAAQTVPVENPTTGSVPPPQANASRRRIEIRFTRLAK